MARRFLRYHFDAPEIMAFCVGTGFARPVALRIARGWERLIANASGAAADCRQVLTPKGGHEDGDAR